MSVRAVSDRVILIPEPAESKIGNVLVPDSSKPKPMRGVVLSTGPDCRQVKKGDEIYFLQGHGAIFEDEGEERLVIKESDVLCAATDDTLQSEIEELIKKFHKK